MPTVEVAQIEVLKVLSALSQLPIAEPMQEFIFAQVEFNQARANERLDSQGMVRHFRPSSLPVLAASI